MSPAVFSPKQVAQALGVSESSVKRWVDNGQLPAAKTAGGHRKVPLPSIAEFLRKTGHELADPALLGMVAVRCSASPEGSQGELFTSLVGGDEAACREIVLSYYQRGETVADLGDLLIGPAFKRVGDGWSQGTVKVYQERRSCEVMIATLHELRRWLPAPADDAPLAVVATPQQDFAEVPARLVELVLLAAKWRVVMAGCGLPLEEIRGAITRNRPRLACLSVTHLADPMGFASECNAVLVRPLRESSADTPAPRFAIGGTAVTAAMGARLNFDLVADQLADLARFQASLKGDD